MLYCFPVTLLVYDDECYICLQHLQCLCPQGWLCLCPHIPSLSKKQLQHHSWALCIRRKKNPNSTTSFLRLPWLPSNNQTVWEKLVSRGEMVVLYISWVNLIEGCRLLVRERKLCNSSSLWVHFIFTSLINLYQESGLSIDDSSSSFEIYSTTISPLDTCSLSEGEQSTDLYPKHTDTNQYLFV
jgi:hypothetical protein